MKKIHLSKETLRVLTADEARAVAGGSVRDDCNPTETRPATGCGGTTTTGTTTGPSPTSPQATCPSPTSPAATCPTPTTPAAGCPGTGPGTTTTDTIRRCPV